MRFFKISNDENAPDEERRLAKWAEDMDYESTIVCPVNDGHQRPGKRLPNLSVVLPQPPLDDFVWTWHGECLVQDRVLNLFRSEGFAGYDLKPVKARFRRDINEPPMLWEVVTTGQRVRAAASAGLYVKNRCDACGLIRYSAYEDGLPVDESTWDGSDFFRFEEWGGLFVTERVKECILNNRLAGAYFVQVEDMRWPEGVVKP